MDHQANGIRSAIGVYGMQISLGHDIIIDMSLHLILILRIIFCPLAEPRYGVHIKAILLLPHV